MNYTIEKINLNGLTQKQIDLLRLLNVADIYYPDPPGSIMGFEQFCNCNKAWMCEHRLQYFADRLKETQCDRPIQTTLSTKTQDGYAFCYIKPMEAERQIYSNEGQADKDPALERYKIPGSYFLHWIDKKPGQ
jgi:hypothetical protein